MIKIKCDMKKISEMHSKYVEEYLAPRFISMYNNTSGQMKQYLESFLGSTSPEILGKLLILCTDRDLQSLIQNEKNIREDIYNKGRTIENRDVDELKTFWDMSLDYKGFGRGIQKGKYSLSWNRHLFIMMTNVKVCPYCNRNYITTYIEDEDEDEIRSTASIDHYYAKAKYPFLQMNIFNMIPSCPVCNSYIKGSREYEHLNPYLDNGSIYFEIDLSTLESLYQNASGGKRILVKSFEDQKSVNSIKAFKLSKIYESHDPIAAELQQKIMDYDNFAENYYTNLLGNIDIGIDNVHKNWFDFLEKSNDEEPLVKLKKDIYIQIRGDKHDSL